MNIIVSAHSGLRYIVLLLLVIAIVNAIINRKSEAYEKKDKMINLFTMIFLHIQLLLGLILYFTSDKVQFVSEMMSNASLRFFDVEHPLLMILAIVLVTLGRKKAEKQVLASKKHQLIMRYYLLGLVLIFIGIPWPFTHANLGVGWF